MPHVPSTLACPFKHCTVQFHYTLPLTLVQTRPQNANADVGGKKLVLVLN